MMSTPRLVEVRENVLKHNDVLARALRGRFREAGVFVVSLVSSPGAGKTMFLEKTLAALRPQRRVAALVGDLATDNDAAQLARTEAPVRQITTGTVCHLEAGMVERALDGMSGCGFFNYGLRIAELQRFSIECSVIQGEIARGSRGCSGSARTKPKKISVNPLYPRDPRAINFGKLTTQKKNAVIGRI